MKKWIVDVREAQVINGEKSYTTSSHIVEAYSALEARLTFSKRCFGSERIQGVVDYDEFVKKSKI